LLNPAHTDTMPCEYLSLDTLERWIVFGFMLCHTFLSHQPAMELWSLALHSSWTTVLFRDEIIYTHSYIQTFFETIKGYSKKVSEVKEAYNVAVSTAAVNHRERRVFLRTAIKELVLICSDQPGLLGPKALFVFMGLCFSRDEVYWLLRHHENPPPRQGKVKLQEDLVDRYLPELLFHMEELRALVRKYSQEKLSGGMLSNA
jgi:NCK-associated protein 1